MIFDENVLFDFYCPCLRPRPYRLVPHWVILGLPRTFNSYSREIQIPYFYYMGFSTIYGVLIYWIFNYRQAPIQIPKESGRLLVSIVTLGLFPIIFEFLTLEYCNIIAIHQMNQKNSRLYPYELFMKVGIYFRVAWVIFSIDWLGLVKKNAEREGVQMIEDNSMII